MSGAIPPYRGRFAPSPTGALHFGSLVAATGSYLEARAAQGQWLVRMEDLDPPREVPGAADDILRTLERLGFQWDAEVLYQSARAEHYRAALDRLERAGLVYPCACTRSEIRALNAASGRDVYPGVCRNGLAPGRRARALRLRTPDMRLAFDDRLQGHIEEWLPERSGDFVLRRADGLHAYQLAVVVDDAAQGITDVVRGADLLDSTCRQILLQRLLEVASPSYLHLPVAANAAGEKLSKQTHAPPVGAQAPAALLCRALRFLGQAPPAALADADLDSVWDWATAHWSSAHIPSGRLIRQSS